jgi:HSP20 family molecular chaperone IbpA
MMIFRGLAMSAPVLFLLISRRLLPAAAASASVLQLYRQVTICRLAGRLNEARRLSLAAKDMNGMNTRIAPFASPLLLGFDAMEKTLERLAKNNDGYPPYNIERLKANAAAGEPERLRITLAVAGFGEDDLDVTTEENQLIIRGRQAEQGEREFLYRGIASRQFQRCFMLADGMQVIGASLKNGLLSVDLIRPEPEKLVRKINISVSE